MTSRSVLDQNKAPGHVAPSHSPVKPIKVPLKVLEEEVDRGDK